MPNIRPSRVQGQPYGTLNLNNPNGNLPRAPVAIVQPGPSQAKEQFNRPGVPSAVGRALDDLQTAIQAATEQSRSDPTANKNLFEQVNVNTGTNAIQHGLGSSYRGYRICTVRGGFITGHCALPPTSDAPATTTLLLNLECKPSSSTPVMLDVEVWS